LHAKPQEFSFLRLHLRVSPKAIERASHDRMRLISEPDDGIYDALNKGVRNATGDVVGFIHSDDFLVF
jgi:glycosyltransferase involved in cell wall biosynthesis